MATGIILSINPDNVSGTVQVDETLETFDFRDQNFPGSGLAVNSPCSFDIVPDYQSRQAGVYYATNLRAVTINPGQTITGPVTQDVIANTGDVITITGAAAIVTGNIIINGGKVIVEQNAQVNGTAHSVIDGTFVARKGGQVKGGINIDGGGSLKVVNKGKVVGGINIASGGRMIVGNNNGPGFINGTVDILKIRRLDITGDSKING